MNDRVAAIFPPHQPLLRAATAQQGSEIISFNQDPALHGQRNHLIRSGCCIEILGETGITVHLGAEMIQGIQERLRGGVHTKEEG